MTWPNKILFLLHLLDHHHILHRWLSPHHFSHVGFFCCLTLAHFLCTLPASPGWTSHYFLCTFMANPAFLAFFSCMPAGFPASLAISFGHSWLLPYIYCPFNIASIYSFSSSSYSLSLPRGFSCLVFLLACLILCIYGFSYVYCSLDVSCGVNQCRAV